MSLSGIVNPLIDAQGRVIAGADGLGVPIETWQVGDLIVQSHPLTVPPNTPPERYQIQTGLYRPDNVERYRILSGDHSTSDRWLLAAIEVKP